MQVRVGPFSVEEIGEGANARERWNGFLAKCEQSNFYQQYGWRAVNEGEFGHRTFYLAATDDLGVAGVLPLVLLRSRIFGRILCSMPFVNFGGPAAEGVHAERALIERAIEIGERERADYLEIRSVRQCVANLATSTHKVSMSLRLDADPEVLWNAFKSKHRTTIRRVYKDGLRVISGGNELLDVFYGIMVQSWRGLGTPIYRKSYFQRILESFGEQVRIFVACRGDVPIATAFNGHFQHTVEGMWAGGIPEFRRFQANYVLYWEMIRDACERGFQSFHLGRSTAESGAEAFKRKWNAEAKQLYWQYHVPRGGPIPELNASNAKYGLAIEVWRRLPLWTTRLVGPLLARGIP